MRSVSQKLLLESHIITFEGNKHVSEDRKLIFERRKIMFERSRIFVVAMNYEIFIHKLLSMHHKLLFIEQ